MTNTVFSGEFSAFAGRRELGPFQVSNDQWPLFPETPPNPENNYRIGTLNDVDAIRRILETSLGNLLGAFS
jgi:hypothetical protein